MPSLKEIVFAIALVGFVSGIYLFGTLGHRQSAPSKPEAAIALEKIYALEDALNAYDTSRVRKFFTDPVVIADTETSVFYITIIVTLLSTINAQIDVISCSPEDQPEGLSCKVRIFSDLHRVAEYAPSVGTFHLKFSDGSVAYIKEGEFYNDIISESSDKLKVWLASNYPGREKTIWGENGLVHNMVAFINWALYWVRCQLHHDLTPGCP